MTGSAVETLTLAKGAVSPSPPEVSEPQDIGIIPDPSVMPEVPAFPPVTEPEPEPADRLIFLLKVLRWQLGTLCTLAVMFTLYAARAVFVPIALSLLLTLLLRPPVRWMYRRRIPEAVGALICLVLLVITFAAGILPVLGPAQAWMDHFPQHMDKVVIKMKGLRGQFGHLLKVRSQITELTTNDEATEKPIPVKVTEPEFSSGAAVLSITGNVVGMWLLIIVLTFFLLTAGDPLLNNVLMILPTFREKRQTVELIKEIERGISHYLLTVTIINVGLGLVITLALWLMGVPNAPVWGLMTTVFNYIPFIGQGVAGIIITLVAVLSFDSFGYALLVPVVFYSIAAIEGNVITPAFVGRRMSLNPILVLIFLIGWGWMWGIAGAALAVPILAILKISFDRFECTRPVGTLIGG